MQNNQFEYTADMHEQYQKFLQFQQFMEMQKAMGGVKGACASAAVCSEVKNSEQNGSAKPGLAGSGSVKNNKSSAGKTAGSSRRAKKMAALKAKAAPDDKENIAPAIWKPTSFANPASELKKSPEEPPKVMLMPAGESSDEQAELLQDAIPTSNAKKDENLSEDSFDYIQNLVEKEKKTRHKRDKAKDRKKAKTSKEVEKEQYFDAYDDVVDEAYQTGRMEPEQDRKRIADAVGNGEHCQEDCEEVEQVHAGEDDDAQEKEDLGTQTQPVSDLENANSSIDRESILRAALSQLQSDADSVDLMKKILNQFGEDQKSEVLRHLEGIIDADGQVSGKVNEARADRDRLEKVNYDQKDQLEQLQARNKQFVQ